MRKNKEAIVNPESKQRSLPHATDFDCYYLYKKHQSPKLKMGESSRYAPPPPSPHIQCRCLMTHPILRKFYVQDSVIQRSYRSRTVMNLPSSSTASFFRWVNWNSGSLNDLPRSSNKELEQSFPDGLLALLSLYHAVTFARDGIVLSNDTVIKYLLSTYYVSSTMTSW